MEWVNMRLSELAAIRELFSLGLVLDMSFTQAAAGVGRGYRVEEAVRRKPTVRGYEGKCGGRSRHCPKKRRHAETDDAYSILCNRSGMFQSTTRGG